MAEKGRSQRRSLLSIPIGWEEASVSEPPSTLGVVIERDQSLLTDIETSICENLRSVG